MRQLVVTAAVLEALARELEAWRPREACGFLLGRAAWAHHVAPTLNAASGTGGFAIPDHEVLRVQALAGSEELVAIYHSHPSGRTELSQGDRTALEHATLPWLIVTADELVGYAPASAAPMAVAVTTPTTIRAELRDVTATRSDAKSRHAVRAPSRRRLIRAAASARAVLPPRSSWTQAGMSRARRSAPAARPREQWASGRAAPGDCRFRSRGVYRVYVISLAKGHGGSRAMRPASRNGSPGTFSDDGNRIVGLFELSRDGSTWDDDLAITYRRAAWKPPSFPATRVTPLDALAGDAAAAQFQPVLAQTAVASATRPPKEMKCLWLPGLPTSS
jgi:proteasome lid subunit RPN8/RPN11